MCLLNKRHYLIYLILPVLGHEVFEGERLVAHVALVRLHPVVLHYLVNVKALKRGKAGPAVVAELPDFEMAASALLMLFKQEGAGELSVAHP